MIDPTDRFYETTDEAVSTNPPVVFQVVTTAWGLSIRCLKDGIEMARGRFDYYNNKLQLMVCTEHHRSDDYEQNILLVEDVVLWQPPAVIDSEKIFQKDEKDGTDTRS